MQLLPFEKRISERQVQLKADVQTQLVICNLTIRSNLFRMKNSREANTALPS
jgi:hypothetical protein